MRAVLNFTTMLQTELSNVPQRQCMRVITMLSIRALDGTSQLKCFIFIKKFLTRVNDRVQNMYSSGSAVE